MILIFEIYLDYQFTLNFEQKICKMIYVTNESSNTNINYCIFDQYKALCVISLQSWNLEDSEHSILYTIIKGKILLIVFNDTFYPTTQISKTHQAFYLSPTISCRRLSSHTPEVLCKNT